MPREDIGYKSIGGTGKYRWCKFATITIDRVWMNYPICFEVTSRGRLKSTLQVRFTNVNSLDPALNLFVTDNNADFYIKKTATSVWELYCHYNELYDYFNLLKITNVGGVPIDTTLVNLEEEPTDKIQCSLHSEGIEEQGSNYIRYSSGIQMCWGYVGVTQNGTSEVNFPRSFVSDDKVFVTTASNGSNSMYINVSKIATTYCHFYISDYISDESGFVFVLWQAIGRWK